ncbi:uncharacterized protein LOC109709416 isoform X2 [Ananas comosus]|uniref:Uncharacterized protein LOC109709416 isoform X2 n=1 Tax=Ananas comosus TaxID=4615 RepID=A0A6P5F1L6_ANACO|nr:uncharacterized protein LOC109709416 isoform X2 [Ananas comosus]
MPAVCPQLACMRNFMGSTVHKTRSSERSNRKSRQVSNAICLASKGRGFGTEPTKKDKKPSVKNPKDNLRLESEPKKLISGEPVGRNRQAPELTTGIDRKSSNVVLDRQFLEKVEAVRRSALEKKKADENKIYQAIDYDAPVESEQSTIGFGTKVGVGIAVLVFGLVFAFGDFLPYRSDDPIKDATVVEKKLTPEEKETLQRTLESYEATLSKSPKDLTALEGTAVTLVELGEYQKASTLLEKLCKESPNNVDAYRLLGEVKYELKDYEGSSSAYRSALSLSDGIDFEVLRGLTNSLLAAKRPDEAIQVLLSSREKLNEENQKQLSNLVDSNGDDAKKTQKIDPIQVDLLIGKAYSDWGNASDAVAVYDKLINEHPDDFRGYLAKGIILKENGKLGDAERMFIQAKFFAPDAAKALVDRYARK